MTIINVLMKNKRIFSLFLFVAFALAASASGRKDILLNDGWKVKAIEFSQRGAKSEEVTLPHTWNALYEAGTHRYERTAKAYERNLNVTEKMLDGRLWLYFEGVNTVATVFVNKRSVGEHKGGYTAFCLEITDKVKIGDNLIEVWVSNAFRTDVLPLSGDFNVYGGIHRPVHLILTGKDCIRPDYYASPGVFVRQDKVSRERAELTVTTMLSAGYVAEDAGMKDGISSKMSLLTTMYDAQGRVVAETSSPVTSDSMNHKIVIDRPHLWNGRKSPYRYRVTVTLKSDDDISDEVSVLTGLRYFNVDNRRGFFLNGEHYDLHGVNRHEDFQGVGSALGADEYKKDIELLCELGATAVRLAHYPHGESMIDMADSCGFVLWSEIPLCGPGGYLFTGYLNSAAENASQSMREMILQKYNHPSICFWGLFNELLKDNGQMREYDDPVPEVRRLNDLAHRLDPSRLTAFATCVDHNEYKGCADLMAWNRYFSWKTAEPEAASFFDDAAATAFPTPMGVSEYGRGGAIMQHADPKYSDTYSFKSNYHPEEYQTLCHEGYWAALKERDFLWIKTVWQFSDTQSTIKNEGDHPGRNDKGLVTYDRETRKDAFYFYKANWNPDPMVHLCSKRFTRRTHAVTDVRVYTTMPEVTLYVNGKRIAKLKTDDMHRAVFTDVTLREGDNKILVEAGKGNKRLSDSAVWTVGNFKNSQ